MRVAFFDEHDRLREGWRVLGYLAAAYVMLLIAEVIYGMAAPRRLPLMEPWIEGLAYAIPTWFCLHLEGNTLASIGFQMDKRWLRDLGLGTLGGGAIMGTTALLIYAMGGFQWARNPSVGAGALLRGACLYLGVALAEETYCRGYPFQRLTRSIGFPAAQIVFAFFFAYLHWGNPGMHGATKAWATLNIGLAALLLGLAWIRTGSLALPIGIHLGWNWTQGSLLGFGVSGTTDTPGLWSPVFHGRPAWLTGGAFGLEASLPCALVCGAAIVALALWKGNAPKEAAD